MLHRTFIIDLTIEINSVEYFNLWVSHTHFEVDQAIRKDKQYLYRRNAYTLDHLNKSQRSRISKETPAVLNILLWCCDKME